MLVIYPSLLYLLTLYNGFSSNSPSKYAYPGGSHASKGVANYKGPVNLLPYGITP